MGDDAILRQQVMPSLGNLDPRAPQAAPRCLSHAAAGPGFSSTVASGSGAATGSSGSEVVVFEPPTAAAPQGGPSMVATLARRAPASAATAVALTRRGGAMGPPAGMARPVAVVRPKKRVMDEDEFLIEMGRIIERDYYPDLPKLRMQLEWLEALESKDSARIAATAARIREDTGRTPKAPKLSMPTPIATPAGPGSAGSGTPLLGGGTPGPAPPLAPPSLSLAATDAPPAFGGVEAGGGSGRSAGTPLSLDQFHATHTSEDNDSFDVLLKKVNDAKARMYWWAFDDNAPARSAQMMIEGRPHHDMFDDEKKYALDRAQRPAALDSWPHRVQNQLMFLPDPDTSRATSRVGQVTAGTDAPTDRASERAAMGGAPDPTLAITDGGALDPALEAAPARAPLLLANEGGGAGSSGADASRSLLAYRPRSSGASVALALPSGTLLKDNGGIAPPKEILRTNTRFAGNFLDSQAARVLAAAGVSPAGTPEGQAPVPSTPQVVPTYGGGSASSEAQGPGVGGYSFVVPPSPAPGVGDDVPVMTWGDIEGTPLILDPHQTPLDMTPGTSKFRVPELPPRDALAHALDVRNKEKKKQKAAATAAQRRAVVARHTHAPGSVTPLMMANMSPAAQAMAQRLALQTLQQHQQLHPGAKTPLGGLSMAGSLFGDASLRASYGGAGASGTPRSSAGAPGRATPALGSTSLLRAAASGSASGSAGGAKADKSLTDGLLKF